MKKIITDDLNEEEEDAQFDENEIKLLPFVNRSHISNHLNYLFHTDVNNKFENENSVNNYYFVFQHSKNKYYCFKYFKDIAERKRIKNLVYNALYFVKNIGSISMICLEGNYDVNYLAEDGYKQIFHLVEGIKEEGYFPIVFAVHCDAADGRPTHLHGILINMKDQQAMNCFNDKFYESLTKK